MRFDEKWTGGLLILVGAALLLFWNGQPATMQADGMKEETASAMTGERQSCRVLTVYDGDTLGCDLDGNGRIERPHEEIRLLGIDTPEMHYSKKNKTYGQETAQDEPFAREASRWLETKTLKKQIYLEFDRKRRDRYERTLAYLYAGPDERESLNARLLETGFAKVLFLGKNRRHEEAFRQVEAQARDAKRGLWDTP